MYFNKSIYYEGRFTMSVESHQTMVSTSFRQFDEQLLSLEEQLARLLYYNVTYWNGRLTDEWFRALTTDMVRPQHVYDCEVFHVSFPTLVETIEMWWRVYVGELGAFWRDPFLDANLENFQLWSEQVHEYSPGIHRVRINLVSYWGSKKGLSIDKVRCLVKETHETLAQLEVLSALGLHLNLLKVQDGVNLPFCDMPGTNLVAKNDPRSYTLSVRYSQQSDKLFLVLSSSDISCAEWAVSMLRDTP